MTSGSSSLSFVLGISPSRRTRCPSKRLNCEFRERDYRFMNMALEQAKLAYDEGEVPVGCVLVSEDGEILSMGRNRVHSKMDCTCHAEIECLRSAMAAAHNWRLLGSVIYCTLEPCLMCLGAIQLARVAKLKYGADDVRMGAVHSWISVPSVKHPFHEVKISGGLLATESSNLLRQFFRERRKEARTE